MLISLLLAIKVGSNVIFADCFISGKLIKLIHEPMSYVQCSTCAFSAILHFSYLFHYIVLKIKSLVLLSFFVIPLGVVPPLTSDCLIRYIPSALVGNMLPLPLWDIYFFPCEISTLNLWVW